MPRIRFIRRPVVQEILGHCSISTVGNRVRARLLTRPVPLCGATGKSPGAAVGWPAHEVEAIAEAILAGKSDAQIRELVERLERERAAEGQPA